MNQKTPGRILIAIGGFTLLFGNIGALFCSIYQVFNTWGELSGGVIVAYAFITLVWEFVCLTIGIMTITIGLMLIE